MPGQGVVTRPGLLFHVKYFHLVTGGVGVESEVLKMAASQGLWAVLFVLLLFYILKENSKREAKYQEIISDLSSNLNIIKDVRDDVKEIKNKIYG